MTGQIDYSDPRYAGAAAEMLLRHALSAEEGKEPTRSAIARREFRKSLRESDQGLAVEELVGKL